MLGAGHSMKDIAAELDLSRKTIETYRRRAKEKLGFDTVSELLQYAVQWSYGRGQFDGHDESA
jgi:DNA-binding CsgD family transcriptional regulator